MIWLYEKEDDAIRLETRYDNEQQEYVLTVYRGETGETERYERLDDFRQRLLALEKQLTDERWQRAGDPVLDPDGWPKGRPS